MTMKRSTVRSMQAKKVMMMMRRWKMTKRWKRIWKKRARNKWYPY
jgi:hypothetical protein